MSEVAVVDATVSETSADASDSGPGSEVAVDGADAAETSANDAGQSDVGDAGYDLRLGTAGALSLGGGQSRLYSVVSGPNNTFFATGTLVVSDDAYLFAAKFDRTGALDTSFGSGGIARVNVSVGSTAEVARGIVVQSTGKVVVAGVALHPGATDTADTDFALVRFDANGELDKTFGSAGTGVVLVDVAPVFRPPTPDGGTAPAAISEAQWGLAKLPGVDDGLWLAGRAADVANQAGAVVTVRLDANGGRVGTYGTDGVKFADIDVENQQARTLVVLSDGSGVVGGYGRGVSGSQIITPLLLKLSPTTGQPDQNFASAGLFAEPVLPNAAEVYGVAVTDDSLVTIGYGRATASSTEPTDLISIRVSSSGKWDRSFGDNGILVTDVAGRADNGRGIFALPDGRVVFVGRGAVGVPGPDGGLVDNAEGIIGVVRTNGTLDTGWAERGIRRVDLGNASEQFWSGALSSDGKSALIVGETGPAATVSAARAVLQLP